MPSDNDDGEDIAIGGTPEDAAAITTQEAEGAAPGAQPAQKVKLPSAPAEGGASVDERPARRDPPRTRRGFDKAALVAAAKKMVEQADEEDPASELITPHVEAEAAAKPAGGEQGAAAKPAADAKPGDAAGEAKPPDNPDLAAAWDAYDQANAALEARERSLAEREASPLVSAEAFLTDPLGAMKALIKAEYGDGARQDDLDAELADIVTMMSYGLAGTSPTPGNINHELRQQKRELRHLNLGNRRASAARAKEQATEKTKGERATAIGALDAELKAVDPKTKTAPLAAGPWLAKHENPAEVVLEVMRTQYQRSRNVIPLAVAVKLADAQVRKDHLATVTRYQSLLTPTVAPATPVKPTVNQGDHQRRSATLSNTGASEGSTPQPREAPLSEEDRRRRTFDKFRPIFAAQGKGAAED